MKGDSITFRPKLDHRQRLKRLAAATERSVSYFIEKAIEAHLPALEQKHAKELADHAGKPPVVPTPEQLKIIQEMEQAMTEELKKNPPPAKSPKSRSPRSDAGNPSM